jgi:DNA helicase-2/ATP-dependent DNA helicase PcrA
VSPFVLEALGLSEKNTSLQSPSPLQQIARYAPTPSPAPTSISPLQDHEILHLSYYQMDDYLTCPLKYKYVHILKVPIYRHHSIIYGNALHRAIQEYLRAKTEGRPFPIASLHEAFRGAWSGEGFLSREHEQLRFEAGLATLTRFYEREEREGVLPTYVEREFSFQLDKNRIAGRWDRIDEGDGSVTIIDYKSSNVQTQEKADQEIRKNLQLSLYAYAYWQIEGRIPDRVELHFLESGLTGSLSKTEEDLEKTVEEIRRVASGIRSGDFGPRPTYIACRYCPYREICPYTATQE